jgi:hypothetical protein
MFAARHHFSDINAIPSNWIMSNYMSTPMLTGQSVKIKSMFNPSDKSPSMYLYYSMETCTYRFKCFSTGTSGSALELMMHYWGESFRDTAARIRKDYTEFLRTGNKVDSIAVDQSKWKISGYAIRGWNVKDAEFWPAYNISSEILAAYNVFPLGYYEMSKTTTDSEPEQEFRVSSGLIYGYFTKAGVLYKIYQPGNKERKFIKVADYIQGSDQLGNNEHLLIVSSLKDLMTVASMNLKIDLMAPDSENSFFGTSDIHLLKKEYKTVSTMMDSDTAGIASMQHYYDQHGLPFCYMPREKDISDIAKVHGITLATSELVVVLHKAIEKYSSLQKIGELDLPF